MAGTAPEGKDGPNGGRAYDIFQDQELRGLHDLENRAIVCEDMPAFAEALEPVRRNATLGLRTMMSGLNNNQNSPTTANASMCNGDKICCSALSGSLYE